MESRAARPPLFRALHHQPKELHDQAFSHPTSRPPRSLRGAPSIRPRAPPSSSPCPPATSSSRGVGPPGTGTSDPKLPPWPTSPKLPVFGPRAAARRSTGPVAGSGCPMPPLPFLSPSPLLWFLSLTSLTLTNPPPWIGACVPPSSTSPATFSAPNPALMPHPRPPPVNPRRIRQVPIGAVSPSVCPR